MLEGRWMRKSFKSGNIGDNNGGGGDDGEPNENCKFGPTFGWAQIFFLFFLCGLHAYLYLCAQI
jgi:hypothetical protein